MPYISPFLDDVEMYCLNNDPPVKVTSFDGCRSASTNLSDITMTVSHFLAVPTAYYAGPNSTRLQGSDVTILNMLRRKYGFEYRLKFDAKVDSPDNKTMGQIMRVS